MEIPSILCRPFILQQLELPLLNDTYFSFIIWIFARQFANQVYQLEYCIIFGLDIKQDDNNAFIQSHIFSGERTNYD